MVNGYLILCFNSSMVRFGGWLRKVRAYFFNSFNSSMVRFGDPKTLGL